MVILEKYITRNPCFQANVRVADDRYARFQQRGPEGGMLHSVGCAQPSAQVFYNKWNNENYDKASVHAVIDANSGDIWHTMPWNYRGWHCGGSANNTHLGVEMCESKWIQYPASGGVNFTILDKPKAQADAKRAYDVAVELFAMLATMWNWNPMTDIISHKEGGKKGIASGHVDPEHYWSRLGMSYTMNGFRNDVKNKMEDVLNMTRNELTALIDERIDAKTAGIVDTLNHTISNNIATSTQQLTAAFGEALDAALISVNSQLDKRLGAEMIHVKDIPWEPIRERMRRLVDEGYINGGTSAEEDPDDIRLPLSMVRILAICDSMIQDVEKKIAIVSQTEEE